MRITLRSPIAALLALVLLPAATAAQAVHWRDGRWYDGRGFQRGSFYSVDGVLTRTRPARVDRVVELGGGWVVPPFGDAHHHGIDGAAGLDAKVARFLEHGVFYVKNPNVIPDLLSDSVRRAINHPGSIDVAFSNGGLTSRGGHPGPLHDHLAGRGVFPGLAAAQMEGRAYFVVDDTAALAREWPRIVAGRPDFLKTYLLFSEEFARRRHAPRAARGLDPAVLRAVVARARAAGLRVSTHVETAADFRHAVEAGVDEINHLPIPRHDFSPDLSAYRVDAATAALAARRGISVVTTVSTHARLRGPGLDAAHAAAVEASQHDNMARLHAAGVSIALGSDGISGEHPMTTARDEALFLHARGFFDAATLLRLWTEDTARTIFPGRRIGRLAEGYEASFLVLDADPLRDFSAVGRIGLRVKQGRVLPVPAAR